MQLLKCLNANLNVSNRFILGIIVKFAQHKPLY